MKKHRLLLSCCLAGYGLVWLPAAYAEIAVIVNPANTSTTQAADVQRIFLGKSKSFPGGGEAMPFNLKDGNASRGVFDQGILNKNASQVKAYWSQLVFTGKGSPPKDAADDEEMKKWVAANANAIGYIDAGKVDGSVKVLFKQ